MRAVVDDSIGPLNVKYEGECSSNRQETIYLLLYVCQYMLHYKPDEPLVLFSPMSLTRAHDIERKVAKRDQNRAIYLLRSSSSSSCSQPLACQHPSKSVSEVNETLNYESATNSLALLDIDALGSDSKVIAYSSYLVFCAHHL